MAPTTPPSLIAQTAMTKEAARRRTAALRLFETRASVEREIIKALCSKETLFADDEVMKQKFTLYCLKHIPERAHFSDCVALISMMVKSGRLNLNGDGGFCFWDDETGTEEVETWRDFRDDTHSIKGNEWTFGGDNDEMSEEACPEICNCKLDDDGRIVGLSIFGKFSCGMRCHWMDGDGDVEVYNVADIIRLERLVELTICGDQENQYILGCELPPQLQHLTLWTCESSFFQNFPADMKQHNNLKTITVVQQYKYMGLEGPTSPFLRWMVKGLPNLEHLAFKDIREMSSVNCVINALRDYDWCCRERLKTLGMNACELDSDHFETLLLEIAVPTKFPNLSILSLYYNKIASIQGILDRIDERDLVASNSTLRRLELGSNPILDNIESNNLEAKTAILRLLYTFKKIFTLGRSYGPTKYPPDVQYALVVNHTGRHLLEGQQDVALPLCPLILERAYQKSGAIGSGCGLQPEGVHCSTMYGLDGWRRDCPKDATGVYYLLQHALLASHNFGKNDKKKNPTIDHGHDVAKTDDDNEDNDSQQDSPASKKCKLA